MASIVLALHILCVIALVGIIVSVGWLAPAVFEQTLDAPQRLQVLVRLLERSRAPVLGAIAGIFITGFFNIANLQSRVGALLLIKLLLAVTVAAHGLAMVNGIAGRLAKALAEQQQASGEGAGEWEAVLQKGERSCRRMAMSTAVLVAIIVLLSLNL